LEDGPEKDATVKESESLEILVIEKANQLKQKLHVHVNTVKTRSRKKESLTGDQEFSGIPEEDITAGSIDELDARLDELKRSMQGMT